MAFRTGDHVHVASFGKGVVREVRNGGRCLVDVKGRSMLVDEAQLTAVNARKRPVPDRADPSPPGVPQGLERSHVPASLDLHGMTTDQAVAALDAFINDAILGGHSEVFVIHGRSGGRLRNAVQQRLKNLPVRGFHLDPSNPGVTIVIL